MLQTYIVIVGIVDNTLLAGLEGGISLERADWVLHVAFPIYAGAPHRAVAAMPQSTGSGIRSPLPLTARAARGCRRP